MSSSKHNKLFRNHPEILFFLLNKHLLVYFSGIFEVQHETASAKKQRVQSIVNTRALHNSHIFYGNIQLMLDTAMLVCLCYNTNLIHLKTRYRPNGT